MDVPLPLVPGVARDDDLLAGGPGHSLVQGDLAGARARGLHLGPPLAGVEAVDGDPAAVNGGEDLATQRPCLDGLEGVGPRTVKFDRGLPRVGLLGGADSEVSSVHQDVIGVQREVVGRDSPGEL